MKKNDQVKQNNDFLLFGKRIKELRVALGMNQEEFGAGLGWSKQQISKFEKGDGGLTYTSITKILGMDGRVNGHWFLTGEGSMFREKAPSVGPGMPNLDGVLMALRLFLDAPPALQKDMLGKAVEAALGPGVFDIHGTPSPRGKGQKETKPQTTDDDPS